MTETHKVWLTVEALEDGSPLEDRDVSQFVSWLNHQIGEGDFPMRISNVSWHPVFPSYLKSESHGFTELPEEEQLQHMITERLAFAADGNGLIEMPGDWRVEELNTDGGTASCTAQSDPLVTGFTIISNAWVPDTISDTMFDVRISRRTYPFRCDHPDCTDRDNPHISHGDH